MRTFSRVHHGPPESTRFLETFLETLREPETVRPRPVARAGQPSFVLCRSNVKPVGRMPEKLATDVASALGGGADLPRLLEEDPLDDGDVRTPASQSQRSAHGRTVPYGFGTQRNIAGSHVAARSGAPSAGSRKALAAAVPRSRECGAHASPSSRGHRSIRGLPGDRRLRQERREGVVGLPELEGLLHRGAEPRTIEQLDPRERREIGQVLDPGVGTFPVASCRRVSFSATWPSPPG